MASIDSIIRAAKSIAYGICALFAFTAAMCAPSVLLGMICIGLSIIALVSACTAQDRI